MSVVYPEASYVAGTVVRETQINLGIGDGPVMGIRAYHRPDGSIDETLQAVSETRATVVTDEYDVPAGAAVVSRGTAAAGEMVVLLPLSSGFVEVRVTVASAESWCPAVVSAVERRVVESIRIT